MLKATHFGKLVQTDFLPTDLTLFQGFLEWDLQPVLRSQLATLEGLSLLTSYWGK